MSVFKQKNTVEVGTPITVVLPVPLHQFRHIQFDVASANTLAIATLVSGQTVRVTQSAAATAETVILDMIDVESILLTATGGDVDVVTSAYLDQ